MSHTSFNISPPIIAHRGASRDAPENTLAAFRKAKQLGICWIEFDVMLAACQQVVVIHDETLERTTNGQGNVCDWQYAELKALDAGSWFSDDFSGETIPTLDLVLSFLQDEHLLANIEIKPHPGVEELIVTKVLANLSHYPKLKESCLISSFSFEILELVRKFDAGVRLGFLMHKWLSDWQSYCEKILCTSVNVNQKILTPTHIDAIKTQGYYLTAYTVNQVHRAKELYSWGVDAVFSDVPGLILNSLN